MKKYFLLIFILLLSLSSFSQRIYTGIVIDSATFEELPGTVIQLKHSETRAVTDYHGGFSIRALRTDTLILTMLGFHTLELPLFFEEDVLFIRMSEQIRLLEEITIRATRLYPNEIVNRTKVAPKRMSLLDGLGSPIDYFWKLEREKRKLARIVEESNKTQTYRQVVNDPVVKEIMIKTYELSELIYYQRLAAFNQLHASIAYSSDPEEIMEALHHFFLKAKE